VAAGMPNSATEMRGGVRLGEVDAYSDPRWDAFVRRHPRATANHLGAWARILEQAYGFKPRYLTLTDESGAIIGVMPLVYARGLVSGPRLNSLPALRWAGPLAATLEQEAELLTAACELVRTGKPKRLAVVTANGGHEGLVADLGLNPQSPSWRLTLPSDPAEYRRNLKKRSKGCFYDVKKAWASGVTVREARSTADLRTFYRFYLQTMRRRRALPRPFKKMSLASELLGPEIVRLSIAELDGVPVAGLLCHVFNGMVEAMYQASDERYLSVHPNHALYDHAIVTAIEQGLDYFDFGGAWPDESLASFKRRWGAEPVERFGYAYPAGADESEEGSEGAGASALIRAQARIFEGGRVVSWSWNRVPLPVTRLIGELVWKYV
jgi:serine/alanine adding enzyme